MKSTPDLVFICSTLICLSNPFITLPPSSQVLRPGLVTKQKRTLKTWEVRSKDWSQPYPLTNGEQKIGGLGSCSIKPSVTYALIPRNVITSLYFEKTCFKENERIQWGSEIPTCPEIEWSIFVLLISDYIRNI